MRFVIIGLAAAIAAQSTAVSAQTVIQAVPERPRIVVDGYGEVKTPPDIARISYVARGEGQSSDDAVRAMTKVEASIEGSLRKLDAGAEFLTGDVKVTPVRSDSCKEEDEGSPQLSTGPCAILGYVATQSITVRTIDVKDAGTMVGLAGRDGGFEARIGGFDLREARPSQQQATAAALNDASIRAAAIAAATHVSLGPILSINTAPRQDVEAVVVTGSRIRMPKMEFNAPPPVPVNVTPEPITTSANVTVTYAIAQ